MVRLFTLLLEGVKLVLAKYGEHAAGYGHNCSVRNKKKFHVASRASRFLKLSCPNFSTLRVP